MDLANTLACPACRVPDGLATLQDARQWVGERWGNPPTLLDAKGWRQLLELRRAVLELFHARATNAPPPKQALAQVNAMAARWGPRTIGAYRGSRWVAARAYGSDAPGERVAGHLAALAIEALTGAQAGRLRSCHSPGCAHYLMARTRTQIWCSPTGCGNRARVARHYQRTRARRPRGRTARTRGGPSVAPG